MAAEGAWAVTANLGTLNAYFEPQLGELERHMRAGLGHWPWTHRDRMRDLVEGHLCRHGKRLRPLFAMLSTDLLGGQLGRVLPVAAAVELYHSASLVLDDVQDNTEFRRGGVGVHVQENVSNAINFAGVVRSFCYYPVHESPHLTSEEKLAVHRRIDSMATMVPLGQSIDIGWHQGWYHDVRSFPYTDMVRLKTGAPFACASACAALLAGADADEWADLGTEVGIIYQLIDDYVDMFGNGAAAAIPADLESGKPSRPVGILLKSVADEPELARRVAEDMSSSGRDRQWILDLMWSREVPALLDAEVRARASAVVSAFAAQAVDDEAHDRMQMFVEACLAMMSP